MTRGLRGCLFDKDGTLFDFGATWNGWAGAVIAGLARGDADLTAALARAWHYDLAACALRPTSPVIAGTEAEAAALLVPHLPGHDHASLSVLLRAAASRIDPVPAVPLAPLLGRLRGARLALGVMTNDSERAARAQLARAGIDAAFDFVAGYDSGHGAKPDAAPLLAFADAMALAPAECAMVGDSTHDLTAARAAGMTAIGVLTGPADRAALAPLADVVLPDISHLPRWLGLDLDCAAG